MSSLALAALACSAPPAPVAEEAHAEVAHEHVEAPAAQSGGKALIRMHDPANVCMLSNRYLGDRPHVPATVDGKTYYGCCANCAAKLAASPEARQARDALTGRVVDKGTAILARDAQNRLLYFENEQSFTELQRSLN